MASSNHAIGFHPRTRRLDHTSPARPDSRYGLSKAFAEDLGLTYANKHGIACPRDADRLLLPRAHRRRMLSTWMSYADLGRLVDAGLAADYLYEVVYGASANTRGWWDNSNAERLGYHPQDNAEAYAPKVEAIRTDDPLTEGHHGGGYLRPDFTGDPDCIV